MIQPRHCSRCSCSTSAQTSRSALHAVGESTHSLDVCPGQVSMHLQGWIHLRDLPASWRSTKLRSAAETTPSPSMSYTLNMRCSLTSLLARLLKAASRPTKSCSTALQAQATRT